MAVLLRHPWRTLPTGALALDGGHPLAQGLIGCWPMHERGGGHLQNLVHAGTLGSGTLQGARWHPDGLDFDGTDDYVDLGDPAEVDFGTGDFALGIWMQTDDTGTAQALIGKTSSGTSRQFVLVYREGVGRLTIAYFKTDNAVAALAADGLVTNTARHHVLAQRAGNTFEIYVDGVRRATGTSSGAHGTMASTTDPLWLGRRADPSQPFNGRLALPMLYRRSLSAAEAAWLAAEPYALFVAAPRRFYLDLAAAGGASIAPHALHYARMRAA